MRRSPDYIVVAHLYDKHKQLLGTCFNSINSVVAALNECSDIKYVEMYGHEIIEKNLFIFQNKPKFVGVSGSTVPSRCAKLFSMLMEARYGSSWEYLLNFLDTSNMYFRWAVDKDFEDVNRMKEVLVRVVKYFDGIKSSKSELVVIMLEIIKENYAQTKMQVSEKSHNN